MADRQYNKIYRKILDESWDEFSIIVAMVLLVHCPNPEGIYDLPLGSIRRLFRPLLARFGVAPQDVDKAIEDAIQELVDSRMIKLYRSNHVVWVKRKWSKERYHTNENNQIGAIRDISSKFPEVLIDFCKMYELNPDSAGTKSNLVGHTDTDSDSETDTDTESKRNTYCSDSGESKRRSRSISRKKKPEPQHYVDLAKTVAKEINLLIDKHNHPHGRLDNHPDYCATPLRLLLTSDNDGIPEASRISESDIIPTLRHAWDSYAGAGSNAPFCWGPNLISIRNFRKKTEGCPQGKFRKAWEEWKGDLNPSHIRTRPSSNGPAPVSDRYEFIDPTLEMQNGEQ